MLRQIPKSPFCMVVVLKSWVNPLPPLLGQNPNLNQKFCLLGFPNLCIDFCAGSHHLYTIYDPRDDSPEDWDYWHLICRVLFSHQFVHCHHHHRHKWKSVFFISIFLETSSWPSLLFVVQKQNLKPQTWSSQTTPGPSGSPGKLLVLESRTELDCLIEFINDEFDDPKTLRWTLCLIVGFGNSHSLTS